MHFQRSDRSKDRAFLQCRGACILLHLAGAAARTQDVTVRRKETRRVIKTNQFDDKEPLLNPRRVKLPRSPVNDTSVRGIYIGPVLSAVTITIKGRDERETESGAS